ncbi:polysaccharide pyruvyl transferase family protein [Roseobacter sp. OBYS 0001]|uniref:polysaccharide pyruvyl transferase family protein n=1 Tax=Roseobacter sp. OBYS 0001 TaxID=882651 RepID=UPI001BC1FD96|nr:polysaccharide pyruvyl transferase family protein [Roseobacter sp. OBYS 0001]GIT89411.1 hypothetical protein ROBYS_44270 [Roseobacter sp. OBYS 0001]
MIVTVCGAYVNCGDHLIGARARSLLREHVEQDILVVDRKAITPEHYARFNDARAVLLTGGPAYQIGIYPDIYPIDRDKVSSRIIPYGLGWKAHLDIQSDAFSFEPQAKAFVQAIHSNIETSSVRDPLTKTVLAANGVDNVLMTGCPAWYDLEHFEKTYQFQETPKTLILSMPPKIQPGLFDLMTWLSKRFPNTRKIASLHHGFLPTRDKAGFKRARGFLKFAAAAGLKGWAMSSLGGNLDKMEALYAGADMHVGYRVHAHLLCLSQRKASILINEDSRGEGQAKALNAPSLNMDKSGDIEHIKAAVEEHFVSKGANIETSIETMRETYPVMKQFLATI